MPRRPAAVPVPVQAALAVPARRSIVRLLRARGPQAAPTLAAALGLHVTTVRFHLDVLQRAGLVTRRPTAPAGPGRPPSAYAAVTAGPEDERGGYAALAGVLAGQLGRTAAERARRAEDGGRAWAADLVPARGPGTGPSRRQAVRQVVALFAEMGFDPELLAAGSTYEMHLRACPFRAAARQHPEVVCSVHLGLLRGVLARLDAPESQARLEPFVRPDLCVAGVGPP